MRRCSQLVSEIGLQIFTHFAKGIHMLYVIGLNEFSGTLYVGNTKVTSGCTSFAVHNEFLLLTTTAHLLRFISLNSDPQGVHRMHTLTAACPVSQVQE